MKDRIVAVVPLPAVLLSILQLGASAIHFLQSPRHFEEDQLYGWFFLGVGALQMAAAVLVIVWRKSVVYVLLASGSAGLLMLWILTRTVGIPLGEDAGRIQVVGAADLTAGVFELLTLILSLVWLRYSLDGRTASVRRGAMGKSVVLATALLVTGGVAMRRSLTGKHVLTSILAMAPSRRLTAIRFSQGLRRPTR